jgi:hypothetical protein
MSEYKTFHYKPSIGDRLSHAWNAFRSRDPTLSRTPWYHAGDGYLASFGSFGGGFGTRLDKTRLRQTTERSIVAAVYNRIALDVSEMIIQHVKVDKNGRYEETVNSGLNNCLTVEANIDQTAKAFIQDLVLSMFDEGVVAAVPIDTDVDPEKDDRLPGSFEIHTMRTGKITAWYPKHVRVEVYNDNTGDREEITVAKKAVAIIENPLYPIMNEPNSTLKRLIAKLNLLDSVDEQTSSGKLDILIQLPYIIKTPQRRAQAEERRKDIEMQLSGSKYGIAYTDGTERLTQLNRPVENNLMNQVQYLQKMLYDQLGTTETVFNGTADQQTMLNYENTSVLPCVSAIVGEFTRKFLTKTARTQGHKVMAFRDAFKLVPADELANMADKFTRNEIMSSNEMRAVLGMKPSSDPKADELRNKNINQSNEVNGTGTVSDGGIAVFKELLATLEEDLTRVVGDG